ncbi:MULTISPECIES: DUF4199 domain-containing protein [unclassified Sphingobacterium]|uniref:DUF4199 domain-containing protein n=1 Tax=unclassified Sphingobacterium TaxID=2609468 RepID=UPI0025DAAA87|nr:MULTISPECIES: DUF4199 domain-containing protein [unclassified Sphingobacterium]
MTDQLSLQEPDSKKQSITYGLYLGIIAFVLGIVIMYISKSTTSLVVLYGVSAVLQSLIIVVVAVLFSLSIRKSIGGYWSFSEALKKIFIMFAVAALISSVGSFAFTKFVEPTLQEEVINNTSNLTIEMMEKSGATETQIDEAIAKLDELKAGISTISFWQVFKGLAIMMIFYFVLALILAAILKKEKPFFQQHPNVDPNTDPNANYGAWPDQNNPN